MFGADEPLYTNHTVWYLWKREKHEGKLLVHWGGDNVESDQDI